MLSKSSTFLTVMRKLHVILYNNNILLSLILDTMCCDILIKTMPLYLKLASLMFIQPRAVSTLDESNLMKFNLKTNKRSSIDAY